jgi:pSer/pThr/pTyr-binding forkhead associated (FHA) protein
MIKLFINQGRDKVRSFEFEADSIFIGRAPDNDIQINDTSVSRKHIRIGRRGDSYWIEDLYSKNGTFVSGIRILPGQEVRLEEAVPVAIGGAVVSVGKVPPEEEAIDAGPMAISGDLNEEDIAVLDSLDIAKEITEGNQEEIEEAIRASQQLAQQEETFVQDRPLTARKNLELIYKVSGVLMQSLNNSDNINSILKTILNYILELLTRLDRGAFILVNAETGEITQLIPILRKSAGDSIKVYSKTIVNRVIKERKPVIMLDTSQEDKDDLSESMELMKVRSVMCVPLISRSKIRGVIYIDSINKPHGFRREDLSLLTALSIPAAYAIENATMSLSEE